jgi:ribosomal protein L11 methyltransferase
MGNCEDYIEIACTLAANCNADASDIVVALLSELGFDSFEESAGAVKAFIPADRFSMRALRQLAGEYPQLVVPSGARRIKKENWNRLWESNFPMSEIAGRIVVHAPFHADIPALEYRICIMPQMSFGTGSHETTSLMMEMMLDIDADGKQVLDAGCGTGILAIFAVMKKARAVTAIDIDEWACRNAAENCKRNGADNVEIFCADIRNPACSRTFDLILANINRNVLLAEMNACAERLQTGGLLALSGFYVSDMPAVTDEAQRNGLELTRQSEKNSWAAVVYRKM